jgi:hypothetical protein
MTCGRVDLAQCRLDLTGAVASHLAELVRGTTFRESKAPSSGLRPPSPQGEKGFTAVASRNAGRLESSSFAAIADKVPLS